MVGATTSVGARPAPLRVGPAVILPEAKPAAGKSLTTQVTGFGDKLTLSPAAQAQTNVLAPQVQGMPATAGKGGLFEGKWHETLDIGFLGRLGLMGFNAVKGGAAAQGPAASLWQALKSFDLDGVWNAGKGLGQVGLQFAGKSAGIAGAISLVENGLKVINHQISVPVAAARVVGDSIGGAAGGFGGAIAGGIGLTLLGALGLAGAPLTIGAAVVGFIGYHYADKAVRRTGAYNWIVRNTYEAVAGITGRR
ncbi:MAG: hypothetical protein FJZ01_13985 [Candidatus Sericytochromatia bacterium]|nr:hypothetical protein [Candidatus Tanganyikabacteria bacterium]